MLRISFSLCVFICVFLKAHAKLGTEQAVTPVEYSIVYVRQPRYGDTQHIKWPEAADPAAVEPGSDLVLLQPDGTEVVLFDTTDGAVTDPYVSLDAKWVYFSYFPDVTKEGRNQQRRKLPYSGADIYKVNIKTHEVVRLTFQEFSPNTGSGKWDINDPVNPLLGYNYLGYGILNTAPAPLANGKIVFTSNRNGFKPAKSFTTTNMQLFVMDEDGRNVELISPMTLGSALHPTPMLDGRIMFSSYESQGLRDKRLWGIWAIRPDGTEWEPILSAFKDASVFHFMTQMSNGDLVIEDYYNKNNFGFGALYKIPHQQTQQPIKFHTYRAPENPAIDETLTGRNEITEGYETKSRMGFTPIGLHSITPNTHARDRAAPLEQGKFTHPSAAPNNNLLVVWSDGPVNKLQRPTDLPAVDSGIYLIPGSGAVMDSSLLLKIKNDPNYNEAWPRAVVPYKNIYGLNQPSTSFDEDSVLTAKLQHGSAYGLIGSSSLINRETSAGVYGSNSRYGDQEPFNTSGQKKTSNWDLLGADSGKYTDDDIWAIRILAMEPTTDKGYGPGSSNRTSHFFFNHINERLRILGEIPIRKFASDGSVIKDYTGAADTSFLAKIPADTAFTFQTLDKKGAVLNMSQTWHQLRPGEVRTNCGGCHAHSKEPVDFNRTYAASENYAIWDLTQETPLLTLDEDGRSRVSWQQEALVNVEFYRDIRPLLDSHCVSCHTSENEQHAGMLALDNREMIDNYKYPLPQDYARLCYDKNANWGIPPVLRIGELLKPEWRHNNASRYIRKLQSRRSMLAWKLFGERLDGWENEDHPTESIPGEPSSLPEGTSEKMADLDYTGTIMPPDNSNVTALSNDQKMTFIRWIDLGCPIDTSKGTEREGYGWFLDETRPALHLSSPVSGANTESVSEIIIGVADAYTGIKTGSLKVFADFELDGNPANVDFAERFSPLQAGVYIYRLSNPLVDLSGGTLTVQVSDNQGNITEIKRFFSVSLN